MDPNQSPLPPQQPVPQPEAMPQAQGQTMSPPNAPQPGISPPMQGVTGQPNTPQPGPYPPQQPVPPSQPQYQPLPNQPSREKKNALKLIILPVVALVVIVGAILFFVLGGAKQVLNKVAGVELENYTSSALAFSIQTPKGWTVDEKNEEYLRYVSFTEPVGDVKDTSAANLHTAHLRVSYQLATSEFFEESEQEYFDGIKKALQRAITEEADPIEGSTSVPEKFSIESEQATTVNGLKAYKVKMKIDNYQYQKDAVGYEYGLFVFVDNKTQYELVLSGHESEGIHSKADSIMNSFTRN